jgi:enoyl-CoA hydratase/carnithine racemase
MQETSQAIVVKNDEKFTIIRFNRPEIRSPLTIAVLVELNEILDTLQVRICVRLL